MKPRGVELTVTRAGWIIRSGRAWHRQLKLQARLTRKRRRK